MEQRPLGKSGIQVSAVGLGCNNFGGRTDFEATQRVVHRALDLGVTLIDTADAYGNRGGSEDFSDAPRGAAQGRRARDKVRLADEATRQRRAPPATCESR